MAVSTTAAGIAPYYAVVTRSAIFDMLMQLKRRLIPEHTDESLEDPLVGMLAVIAFEGARQTSMLDMAARELLPDELARRSSLVALARLAGFALDSYRPARVLVLADVPSAPDGVTVLQQLAQFATRGIAGSAAVFEYEGEDLAVGTLEVESALTEDVSEGTFAALGATWSAPAAGDAVYVGHETLAFAALRWTYGAQGFPAGLSLSWEYYEGHAVAVAPDGVEYVAGLGVLDVDVTTFLGVVAEGLTVRVTSLLTGEWEEAAVDDAGVVRTASALGQVDPSLDPSDYTVSVEWRPLQATADGDYIAQDAGSVLLSWELPFGPDRLWQLGTVNGTSAWWVRGRVVTPPDPAADVAATPSLAPDEAGFVAVFECIQGVTRTDRLGVSTGATNQRVALRSVPAHGSTPALEVGGEPWSIVETLYGAGPAARSATLVELPDGTWQVRFGDGSDGAIPALGAVITASYRTEVASTGNVGTEAIRVARTPSPYLRNVRNPVPATGWATRMADETLGEEGLELAKRALAAFIRRPGGPHTPDAVRSTLSSLVLEDGTAPVARAEVYEQTGGYDTAEVRFVGPGGALLTADQIVEVEAELNGTAAYGIRTGGVAQTNLRLVGKNYVPTAIGVTATVTVAPGKAAGVQFAVDRALRAYLSPLALTSTGAWIHAMGGTVKAVRLQIVAAAAVEDLVDLDLTISGPAGAGTPDVALPAGALPTAGTLTIQVVEAE